MQLEFFFLKQYTGLVSPAGLRTAGLERVLGLPAPSLRQEHHRAAGSTKTAPHCNKIPTAKFFSEIILSLSNVYIFYTSLTSTT